MNADFERVTRLAGSVVMCAGGSRLAVVPLLGGRLYAEIDGVCPHRIVSERWPDDVFGNHGGNTFWPAPEGGQYGLNYRGDEWYVQRDIDTKPFTITERAECSCRMHKTADLVNRAKTSLSTVMSRGVCLTPLPEMLAGYRLAGFISYTVSDRIRVLNRVPASDALIAAWTLEQFAATANTMSFCAVEHPERAVNFDYYDNPGDRISYVRSGFLYETHGDCRGQIGVRISSKPKFIGFYDLSRKLLCIRRNFNVGDGVYFNIADNDQPDGAYSAADAYSIFSSDEDMRAFELETIGGVRIQDEYLIESVLKSETCIAIFEDVRELQDFLTQQIGGFK